MRRSFEPYAYITKLNRSHDLLQKYCIIGLWNGSYSLSGEDLMETSIHVPMADLEAGMETIRQSPKDDGVLKMIVRRPRDDQRESVQEAEITLADGLLGD